MENNGTTIRINHEAQKGQEAMKSKGMQRKVLKHNKKIYEIQIKQNKNNGKQRKTTRKTTKSNVSGLETSTQVGKETKKKGKEKQRKVSTKITKSNEKQGENK